MTVPLCSPTIPSLCQIGALRQQVDIATVVADIGRAWALLGACGFPMARSSGEAIGTINAGNDGIVECSQSNCLHLDTLSLGLCLK
jgi:hypothetical protein